MAYPCGVIWVEDLKPEMGWTDMKVVHLVSRPGLPAIRSLPRERRKGTALLGRCLGSVTPYLVAKPGGEGRLMEDKRRRDWGLVGWVLLWVGCYWSVRRKAKRTSMVPWAAATKHERPVPFNPAGGRNGRAPKLTGNNNQESKERDTRGCYLVLLFGAVVSEGWRLFNTILSSGCKNWLSVTYCKPYNGFFTKLSFCARYLVCLPLEY